MQSTKAMRRSDAKHESHGPYAAIPTPADAGIVMIHAQKILRATPHRTADKRFVAPTPMIAEAITWSCSPGSPPARCSRARCLPSLGGEALPGP